MNKFKLRMEVCLVLIAVFLPVAHGFAQQELTPRAVRAKMRDGAKATVLARHESIKSALKVATEAVEKESHDSFNLWRLRDAIELLGDLRAQEATRFLVTHIRQRFVIFDLTPGQFSDYPTVRSLIQIGNPSIEAIFNRLSSIAHLVDTSPLDPRDLHLFAYVIREIDGEEVGLFRLQLALRNAKTELQKKNFGDLIKIYQKNENEWQIKRVLLADEIRQEELDNATALTVETLLDKIIEEVPHKNFWNDNLLQNYPSIQALIDIGKFSVEGIRVRLKKPVMQNNLRAYAIVIQSVDGGIYKNAISEELKEPQLAEIYKANLIQLQNFLNAKQTDIDFWKAMHPNRNELNKLLQKLERDAQEKERKEQLAWPARY